MDQVLVCHHGDIHPIFDVCFYLVVSADWVCLIPR